MKRTLSHASRIIAFLLTTLTLVLDAQGAPKLEISKQQSDARLIYSSFDPPGTAFLLSDSDVSTVGENLLSIVTQPGTIAVPMPHTAAFFSLEHHAQLHPLRVDRDAFLPSPEDTSPEVSLLATELPDKLQADRPLTIRMELADGDGNLLVTNGVVRFGLLDEQGRPETRAYSIAPREISIQNGVLAGTLTIQANFALSANSLAGTFSSGSVAAVAGRVGLAAVGLPDELISEPIIRKPLCGAPETDPLIWVSPLRNRPISAVYGQYPKRWWPSVGKADERYRFTMQGLEFDGFLNQTVFPAQRGFVQAIRRLRDIDPITGLIREVGFAVAIYHCNGYSSVYAPVLTNASLKIGAEVTLNTPLGQLTSRNSVQFGLIARRTTYFSRLWPKGIAVDPLGGTPSMALYNEPQLVSLVRPVVGSSPITIQSQYFIRSANKSDFTRADPIPSEGLWIVQCRTGASTDSPLAPRSVSLADDEAQRSVIDLTQPFSVVEDYVPNRGQSLRAGGYARLPESEKALRATDSYRQFRFQIPFTATNSGKQGHKAFALELTSVDGSVLKLPFGLGISLKNLRLNDVNVPSAIAEISLRRGITSRLTVDCDGFWDVPLPDGSTDEFAFNGRESSAGSWSIKLLKVERPNEVANPASAGAGPLILPYKWTPDRSEQPSGSGLRRITLGITPGPDAEWSQLQLAAESALFPKLSDSMSLRLRATALDTAPLSRLSLLFTLSIVSRWKQLGQSPPIPQTILDSQKPWSFEGRITGVPVTDLTNIVSVSVTDEFGFLTAAGPHTGGPLEASFSYLALTQRDAENLFHPGTYHCTALFRDNSTATGDLYLRGGDYPNPPGLENPEALRPGKHSADVTLRLHEFVRGSRFDFVQIRLFGQGWPAARNLIYSTPDPGREGALDGTTRQVNIPASVFAVERGLTGCEIVFTRVISRGNLDGMSTLAVYSTSTDVTP